MKADDAVFTKARQDYEHGREICEIEFCSEGYEYSVEVDAASGAIVSFERDFD